MIRVDPISPAQWAVATVYMEAGGEPHEGKLAVAYAILNRAAAERRSISDVVLQPWHFSAWNTDSPTRMRLDTLDERAWTECASAFLAAFLDKVPDPTRGATHYLNEELTRRIRGGSLPSWFDEAKVTARIGRHTFLKGV